MAGREGVVPSLFLRCPRLPRKCYKKDVDTSRVPAPIGRKATHVKMGKIEILVRKKEKRGNSFRASPYPVPVQELILKLIYHRKYM